MVKTLNMTEKIKCQKIDKYFFKSPRGKLNKGWSHVAPFSRLYLVKL